MFRKLLIATVFAAGLPVVANAHPYPVLTGNDMGGIITWSPEHQHVMRRMAGDHCARYKKWPRITSVHARYGDYIGFACQFKRGAKAW